jgi:hypothetical protein
VCDGGDLRPDRQPAGDRDDEREDADEERGELHGGAERSLAEGADDAAGTDSSAVASGTRGSELQVPFQAHGYRPNGERWRG